MQLLANTSIDATYCKYNINASSCKYNIDATSCKWHSIDVTSCKYKYRCNFLQIQY